MESEYDLRDQTVMVTGASRGLGAALALALAQAGAGVSVCARRRESLEEVAAEVQAAGARCHAAAVDVSDAAAVERWVQDTGSVVGAPTALINNASILGPRVRLADHGVEAWRRTVEINLNGAFVVTRAVLPMLLRQGTGSIVNVSSGAALPPRTAWGAYAVSKHALEGFSLNLAAELRESGIRVNIVDPGAMRTGMRAEAYPTEDPATLKSPAAATPVFLWLVSRHSQGVTGQRFRADQWTGG